MSAGVPPTTGDGDDEHRAHDGVTKRRTGPLLARRRQNLDRDGHVTCHDFVDEDGQKIREISRGGPEGTATSHRVNYSRMLGATPSTSTNLELLVIEARQVSEATPEEIATMNPHIPANDEILETATEKIRREGLIPAWEVCDR